MVFGLKLGLVKKGQAAAPADPPACDEPAPAKVGNKNGGKGALTVNEFVARTKRCRERGLEPTKPELVAYARYLGIDPIADGDLMWIADEALNAPLPAEWTEHNDSADRVFYYNVQTHASSWTHPLEQLHRDTYKNIVSFRSGDVPKDKQANELEALRRQCDEAEREAHKELQAWTEHTDDQGAKFYYNKEYQRSVWTDPRPARCHTLYLQMKALRVLSKQCGQLTSPRGDLGHVDRDRQKIQQSLERGLASSDSLITNEDSMLSQKEGKKKKKKKKEHDLEASSKVESKVLSPLATSKLSHSMSEPGDGMSLMGRKPLDMKKPPITAIEEVRAALGVGGSASLPQLGGRGQTPTGLGMRKLDDLDGGLDNKGRTKVKPGIRLQPLN